MRTLNRSQDEHCRYCLDDGTLPVHESKDCGEAYGPCPACESGLAVEFPPPHPKTNRERIGAWGRDGYWRGRDWSYLQPHPVSSPLPAGENLRRIRALSLRGM